MFANFLSMTSLCLTSISINEAFPSPQELRAQIPCLEAHTHFVQKSRKTIEAILKGLDSRLLIVVGPCSIHDLESAREYAWRLSELASHVSDRFFLVMRTYFEKPRTSLGWKGFLYDPDLNGSHNLTKGIRLARQLLLELTDMKVPVGSELLEAITAPYYSDFLSWGCIGARTSASPPHRQLAASLNLPIGFKNSIDGNIKTPVHAVLSASRSHVFLGMANSGQIARIQAEGNPLCHVVLRGGGRKPNYDRESVLKTLLLCQQLNVCDKVMIDCSHDNSQGNYLNQVSVFKEVIDQLSENSSPIKGIMLESHLKEGSQPMVSPLSYGVSITDPCLDWETTRKIILEAYAQSFCRGVEKRLR
ncbi:MAG: 3-deoxy-7-phosphoheptulonate synthase [Chlamydiales bacterium]